MNYQGASNAAAAQQLCQQLQHVVIARRMLWHAADSAAGTSRSRKPYRAQTCAKPLDCSLIEAAAFSLQIYPSLSDRGAVGSLHPTNRMACINAACLSHL